MAEVGSSSSSTQVPIVVSQSHQQQVGSIPERSLASFALLQVPISQARLRQLASMPTPSPPTVSYRQVVIPESRPIPQSLRGQVVSTPARSPPTYRLVPIIQSQQQQVGSTTAQSYRRVPISQYHQILEAERQEQLRRELGELRVNP